MICGVFKVYAGPTLQIELFKKNPHVAVIISSNQLTGLDIFSFQRLNKIQKQSERKDDTLVEQA